MRWSAFWATARYVRMRALASSLELGARLDGCMRVATARSGPPGAPTAATAAPIASIALHHRAGAAGVVVDHDAEREALAAHRLDVAGERRDVLQRAGLGAQAAHRLAALEAVAEGAVLAGDAHAGEVLGREREAVPHVLEQLRELRGREPVGVVEAGAVLHHVGAAGDADLALEEVLHDGDALGGAAGRAPSPRRPAS